MLDPRDRGLAYGDGLFETLRVTAEGRVPLWAGHHRRLQQGARVLGLPVLPECRYQAAIAEGVAALAGEPGVVKLTLTRSHSQPCCGRRVRYRSGPSRCASRAS